MAKIGRNERCPCGSGKKYKQCCIKKAVSESSFSASQREHAIELLLRFIARRHREDREDAEEDLWGSYIERQDELDDDGHEASAAVLDAWFCFDRPIDEDDTPIDLTKETHRLVVDQMLLEGRDVGIAERTWLRRMRASCMRLYEVTDAIPGRSITLREIPEGALVTVCERTASQMARRGDCVAARVIDKGASGEPELELGLLSIPPLLRRAVEEQLEAKKERFFREHPDATLLAFYKRMPPFFHSAWLSSLLDPALPELQNTDGEPLIFSRTRFEILDEPALKRVLGAMDGIESAEEEGRPCWRWVRPDPQGDTLSLGLLRCGECELLLETNSVARSERGRTMLEAAAGRAIRFLATSHEDPAPSIVRSLRETPHERAPPTGSLPRELVEELILTKLGQHYRGWLDESLAALGGSTPRAAAQRPELRDKLQRLLLGLEGQYQSALRHGEPAYDPSWMYEELGLQPAQPDHPPPLAHERLEITHPGLLELTHKLAGQIRSKPGHRDLEARCTAQDIAGSLDAQRLLKGDPATGPLLPWLVDYELHRRKTFWVDRALCWSFSRTEIDLDADSMRMPFASFALVFTDRHALSLAERLLSARPGSRLAGHFARIVTVYIREEPGRSLWLHIAIDALGTDPPEVIAHEVPLVGQLSSAVAEHAPQPLPGLVHLVLSAVLYATSAQAAAIPRQHRADTRAPGGAAPPSYSSEEVYYLPGTIDISRLRQLTALERVPAGRKLLHRFLVRGHWRRPHPSWKDQHPRWIEPYWKGPELGAIVERAYKLTT